MNKKYSVLIAALPEPQLYTHRAPFQPFCQEIVRLTKRELMRKCAHTLSA